MTFPNFQRDRFLAILNHIKAHPETHNQAWWHSDCGTTACFAGHAQIASGKPANEMTARNDAMNWLGLTPYEADFLFSKFVGVVDFEEFAKLDYYSEEGRDRIGYDRDGIDVHGKSIHDL